VGILAYTSGTTDFYTSDSVYSTFMTLNFIPSSSVVVLLFSASGDILISTEVGKGGAVGTGYFPQQFVSFRCRVNNSLTPAGGTQTIGTDIDSYYDLLDDAIINDATSWNAVLTLPITVNPGVSNSVVIEWATNGIFVNTVENLCASSLNDSHRTIVIMQ
jgi:hypothetical protein